MSKRRAISNVVLEFFDMAPLAVAEEILKIVRERVRKRQKDAGRGVKELRDIDDGDLARQHQLLEKAKK
jgi:hypothetical protein